MISLQDSFITQALPTCLSDANEVKAIAYALNKQVQMLLSYIEGIIIYPNIDNLSNEILDALAVELRTHYYEDSFALNVKRNLVKNSLARYKKAGTKQLLEELITLIYGEGKVLEWFEYGGDPNKFKVVVDNTSITDKKSIEFLSLLNAVKRKSSHLDILEIGETSSTNLNYALTYHETTTTKYL